MTLTKHLSTYTCIYLCAHVFSWVDTQTNALRPTVHVVWVMIYSLPTRDVYFIQPGAGFANGLTMAKSLIMIIPMVNKQQWYSLTTCHRNYHGKFYHSSENWHVPWFFLGRCQYMYISFKIILQSFLVCFCRWYN